MSHRFRRVHDDFWVAPQLGPGDFPEIARLGIRTVVNNRPDGEAPGQMSDAEARAAAQASGLVYAHVPVTSAGIFPDHVAAMAEVMESTPGPWLAWCRSGTRSCHLWAMVAARTLPPHEIVEGARAAGYDLSAIWSLLEAIHMANRETAPAP